MVEIIEIGTHHGNPIESRNLESVLEEIAPDIVICEGYEGIFVGHQRYIEMLRQAMEKQGIRRLVAKKWLDYESESAYELRTAKEYCDKKGIPFIWFNDTDNMVNDEQRSRNVQKTIDYIKKHDPDAVIRAASKNVQDIYAAIKRAIQQGTEEQITKQVIKQIKDYYQYVGYRDAKMKQVLDLAIAEHPNTRIATVTGFFHILKDPRHLSFYSRTVHLNPQRRFFA